MGENIVTTRKIRNRKLTVQDRIAICNLYESRTHTMEQIGEIFGVTQPRISQIVNDVYGEMSQIRAILNE